MLRQENVNKIFTLFFISAALAAGVSYQKLYFFHLMLAFILILITYHFFKTEDVRNEVIKNKQFLLLLYFPAFALVSFLWGDNFLLTLKSTLIIFFGVSIIILPLLLHKFVPPEKIFKALSYFFGVHLFICLLESFTFFRLPISRYSHIVTFFGRNEAAYPITMIAPPTSFYWNPNNNALASLIGLIFCIAHPNKIVKIFGTIIGTMIIYFDESNLMILLIPIIISLYLFLDTKSNLKKIAIISVIMIAIGLLFAISPKIKNEYSKSTIKLTKMIKHFPKVFSMKENSIYIKENLGASNSERIGMMAGAIKELKKSPYLGVGFGQLHTKEVVINDQKFSLGTIHNYWLELLTEGSFLFLAPYLFFYFKALFNWIKIWRREQNWFSLAIILNALFIPVAIISLSTGIYFLPKYIFYYLFALCFLPKEHLNKFLKSVRNG